MREQLKYYITRILYSTTLLTLFLCLASCVEKGDGEFAFADWFKTTVVIILVVVVVLFIIALTSSTKNEKKTTEVLKSRGQSQADFKRVGRYVGGHPNQNEEILRMTVRDAGEDLYFYKHFGEVGMPYFRFEIKKASIRNITIEDASTIEKRVTLGRLVLVGVFALAWRKKEKNEVAFVVIEWNDGRFDHNTTFIHEGTNAMMVANKTRNMLISMIE